MQGLQSMIMLKRDYYSVHTFFEIPPPPIPKESYITVCSVCVINLRREIHVELVASLVFWTLWKQPRKPPQVSLILTFRLSKFGLHHCLFRLTLNLFSRHLSHYKRKVVEYRVNAEDESDDTQEKINGSSEPEQEKGGRQFGHDIIKAKKKRKRGER